MVLEAAGRQEVAVDRISFIDASRCLTESRAGATLGKLVVNRDRGGRAEPRVRKRRPKSFPLMTRPRGELGADLLKAKEAA